MAFNQLVNYEDSESSNGQDSQLDAIFMALADPTRRSMLARLSSQDLTVNELAEPYDMSLPAVSKHLKVLEKAGLISRTKQAQYRLCRLETEPMQQANAWLEHYRQLWEGSLENLDRYLAEVQANNDTKPD